MKKIKKSKSIYDIPITIENIYKMWEIINKTCKNKRELYYFRLNLNTNIISIYHDLKNKTYKPGKFRTFMIFEPKPRLVMSQSIKDKIINHFIVNYYYIPYMEQSLIDSNVATRKNKGSNYAMNLLKKYFNKMIINKKDTEIFCLKIDISKYFYSIDHNILINMISKKIEDKDVINLTKIIISETNKNYINNINYYNKKYRIDIPHYVNNKGLSIGAMSSQFLAIYFLNDIDHYIKEELNCKYYIRYMDDFIILDYDKEKLKKIYKLLTCKLEEKELKINKKSNIYRCSNGFTFLGYKYKVTNNKLNISCKKETYKRVNKKLKILKEKNVTAYLKSYGSYYGYFKPVIKKEMEKIKLTELELYNSLKNKYNNYLVIIKNKKFYKTYDVDAKIIWYIFKYNIKYNKVTFTYSAYDKVVNKLKKLNICFIILTKDREILENRSDDRIYLEFCNEAENKYNEYEKEEELINKVKNLIKENPNNYSLIKEYLDKLKSVD